MDAHEAKIYYAVLITSIVLGVVIIYFAITVIRYHRHHLKLHRREIESEITTLEKERFRMARDLHDDLGPLLSVVKFQINEGKDDHQYLSKASRNIDTALIRLREISSNLMPYTLTRKGVFIALEEFTDKVQEVTPLKIELRYHTKTNLDSATGIHIYRIIQEIVQNTLKHAHSTLLTIQIREKHNILFILCLDNGIGFDYESALMQENGVGLRSLKSRAEILGGTMQCISAQQKGTEYFFELPLNHPE